MGNRTLIILGCSVVLTTVVVVYLAQRQRPLSIAAAVDQLKTSSSQRDSVVRSAKLVPRDAPAHRPEKTDGIFVAMIGREVRLPSEVEHIWFASTDLTITNEQNALKLLVDGSAGSVEYICGETASEGTVDDTVTTAPTGIRFRVLGQPIEYPGKPTAIAALWLEKDDERRRLSVNATGTNYDLTFAVGGLGSFELAFRREMADAMIAAGKAMEAAGISDGAERAQKAMHSFSAMSSQQLFERIIVFDESSLQQPVRDLDVVAEGMLILVARLTSPPVSDRTVHVVEREESTTYIVDMGSNNDVFRAAVFSFDADGANLFEARLSLQGTAFEDVVKFVNDAMGRSMGT